MKLILDFGRRQQSMSTLLFSLLFFSTTESSSFQLNVYANLIVSSVLHCKRVPSEQANKRPNNVVIVVVVVHLSHLSAGLSIRKQYASHKNDDNCELTVGGRFHPNSKSIRQLVLVVVCLFVC